ncbi:hypothetical protein EVAR_24418_1 [Eumeta japonica]|uniref:Uncharacterized protein n=1 Tax=Eumeta variegata TaxID=151549 RepID=A0A4C1VTH2_EUMVA|nr:hypothetical protein EVAR_24418_1 [Eumeta japonica]
MRHKRLFSTLTLPPIPMLIRHEENGQETQGDAYVTLQCVDDERLLLCLATNLDRSISYVTIALNERHEPMVMS